MVRALMSSASAAVLRIIPVNQTEQHGHSPCSFSTPLPYTRGPLGSGLSDPIRFALRALSPCLNDDPRPFCAISDELGKLEYLSELRTTTTRKPGFIGDAKLGAVTPDRRGIVTGGLQLSTAQTKRAFASEPEFACGKGPSGANRTKCRTPHLR